MDKNLALTLLTFDRPGGPNELPPADRAHLEALLRADPELAEYARRVRAEDAGLTRAFAALPVPADAKARTLQALLARRSRKVWRRRAMAVSLAAAVFLAVGLGYGVSRNLRPALDGYALAAANERAMEAPELSVREWLKDRGHPATLPIDLDYANFLEIGTQTVQGVDVPVVTFVMKQPNSARIDFVKVYLLSEAHFKLRDLTDAHAASLCTATVHRDARAPGKVWVAVFTTPTLDAFLKPERLAAARPPGKGNR